MSQRQSKKLRELLADGWEVKGFHSDFELSGSSGDVHGYTSGSTILLQKGADMALVFRGFDQSSAKSTLHIDLLTEDTE